MIRTADHYRLLLEHTSDVVFECRASGEITWVSPSSRRVTGWEPEQLIGRSVGELVFPDDETDLWREIAKVLDGEVGNFEGRMRRADGEYRWVAVSAAPLVDDEGAVVGAVGSLRDVHDAVEGRLALAASEEHYRMLADHVGEVVLRFDDHLNILWVSPSARQVLRAEPERLVGKNVAELMHPEDWARSGPEREQLLRQESPVPPVHRLILRVRRGDGTWCWISSRPKPVTDAEDRITGVVSTWTDVTELVEARESAQLARDRLRATLDSLLDPHLLLTAVRDEHGSIEDFVIEEANEALCAHHHSTRDELVGHRYREVVPPETVSLFFPLDVQVAETGIPLILDDFPFVFSGVERRLDVRSVKVGDNVSRTWRDVTHRHDVEAHLSHLATHDTLTGLANRAALTDDLTRAVTAARRSGTQVAVLMLDLDHFKTVNDTVGHMMGDQLLKAAARRLEATVRGGDLVARLGGDEFVIVMRDVAEPKEALQAAQRVVDAFREPITAGGMELFTTASLGIVIAPDESSVDGLLREADAALYRAKRAGRDQWAIFNDDLRDAVHARKEMESQLRPALSLGELAIHYQPEVDLATGRVCAVEALLRWNHPSGELYPASRFIDLAEDIGVIIDSTNWVLHEACATAAAWNTDPARRIELRLNLSRQQLADPNLIAGFDDAVVRSGIDPSLICVEINQDALLQTASLGMMSLGELADRGIGVAVDNFLSGSGALGYLCDHVLRGVRIDRRFLREFESSRYAQRIVAGLVAFGRQLNLRVAADGVETHEQAVLVKSLGCSTAQGYFFAAPVPADCLGEMLDRTFEL